MLYLHIKSKKMIIRKELVSETKMRAWVVKHDNQYYRVSQGMRPLRPMETFIHKSIVTGKVNWATAKELYCTRTMDIETAFNEYLETLPKPVVEEETTEEN